MIHNIQYKNKESHSGAFCKQNYSVYHNKRNSWHPHNHLHHKLNCKSQSRQIKNRCRVSLCVVCWSDLMSLSMKLMNVKNVIFWILHAILTILICQYYLTPRIELNFHSRESNDLQLENSFQQSSSCIIQALCKNYIHR